MATVSVRYIVNDVDEAICHLSWTGTVAIALATSTRHQRQCVHVN